MVEVSIGNFKVKIDAQRKRQNQVRNLPLESSYFKVGNQQAFFLLRAAARPERPVQKSSIVAGSGTGAVGVS